MRFVDTIILLYRVSVLDGDAEKQRVAADLLAASDLCLSVQVLPEF